MATLKDSAIDYKSAQTKNIADLPKVSVSLQLEDREGTTKEGEDFKYQVVIVDGEEYRVPGVVLKNLKVILEDQPTLEYFKVLKSGEGKSTQYTVLPVA